VNAYNEQKPQSRGPDEQANPPSRRERPSKLSIKEAASCSP
jgi:hypothetical protein